MKSSAPTGPNTPKIIGTYIDRVQKRLKLSMTRKLQEIGADITVEQWVLLDQLRAKDHQTQNELADATFKDAPNVSRIINLIVQKKLATRKPDSKDRRKMNIALTEKGEQVIKMALPEIEKIRNQSWEGLTEADYETAVRILDQVFKNLED